MTPNEFIGACEYLSRMVNNLLDCREDDPRLDDIPQPDCDPTAVKEWLDAMAELIKYHPFYTPDDVTDLFRTVGRNPR